MLPMIAGSLGRVTANYTLHPEYGLPLSLISPLPGDFGGVDMEPVAGEILLNTIMSYSQLAFGLGLIGGVARGTSEILGMKAVIEGTAKNPYKKMALMIDTTNEVQEGSHHGDFYQEFNHLLNEYPNLKRKIREKYGPVCEIVPQNAPTPTKKPKTRYFRHSNPSNEDFLNNIVRAVRTTASIAALMSRSHTVWDPQGREIRLTPDIVNNMNDTITDTLGAGQIPKIAIFNGDLAFIYGVFNPTTNKSSEVPETAQEFFKKNGYQPINAERTVMDHLLVRFREKKYKRILLINDATPTGKRISLHWFSDYEKSKTEGDPQIIAVNSDTVSADGQENFDAVFIIGAEDTEVARVSTGVLKAQETGHFSKAPLEVLMEGRGATDKLSAVTKNNGRIHFVHNILAKRCVELLLPEEGLPWFTQHE